MTKKLVFQPCVMNAQNVFLAEPYKVVPYEYRMIGSTRIDKPGFVGYVRIGPEHLFGDSVVHENGNVVFFDTKELAMAACQKHSEKK